MSGDSYPDLQTLEGTHINSGSYVLDLANSLDIKSSEKKGEKKGKEHV